MSKIKLLILLLTSIYFIGCVDQKFKRNNLNFQLGYIGGEYDGHQLLKN